MAEFDNFIGEVDNNSSQINPKEILHKYARFWPVFIVSVVLSLLVVFIYHRYSTERFIVNATLLLPDNNREIDASIFAQFDFNFQTNFLNEIEVLGSETMSRAAIRKLDFDISYYTKGRIKSIEEYHSLPFHVVFDSLAVLPLGKEFKIEFLQNNRFRVGLSDFEGFDELTIYTPGIWIEGDGYRFRIEFDRLTNLEGKEYYFVHNSMSDVLNKLYSSLRVGFLKEYTSIATLSVTVEVPKMGEDYLDSLIVVYQEKELDRKNVKAEKTVAFIDAQLKSLEDTLGTLRNDRAKYRVENRFLDLSSKGNELLDRLNQMDQSARLNRSKIKFLEESRTKLQDDNNIENLILPSVLGIDDNYLNSVVETLSTLNLRRTDLLTSLEDWHSEIKKLDGQIDQLKRTLFNTIDLKIAELREEGDNVNEEITLAQSEFSSYPETERGYLKIERQFRIVDGIYSFLLQKRSEASIVKASNVANSEVVDFPKSSSKPVFPKYKFNYLVGGIVGFILPLLFIVIREFTYDKVETRSQVEAITSVPIIGMVGHKTMDTNLAVFKMPKSAIAETFRSLRSTLNYFKKDKEIQTIMLTSGVSGEGKSFCSMNLASIMAISGKKTVLVGLDLRKPKIYNDFGLTNDIGVSNYLGGFVSMEDVVIPTEYENLSVVLAGPVPPNPSELLMSQKMDDLFEYLKGQFDVIVVDTAPIGIVSDAFNVAKHADATLYVVRHLYTVKSSLNPLKEYQDKGLLKNVSIILNDFKARTGYGYAYGYNYAYNYGYGYGYGYGHGYGQKYGGYYDDDEIKSRKKRRL